jgi:hypothetical protein
MYRIVKLIHPPNIAHISNVRVTGIIAQMYIDKIVKFLFLGVENSVRCTVLTRYKGEVETPTPNMSKRSVKK